MLKTIFEKITISQCIIYVNTVPRVVDLYDALVRDGFPVCCIHSSMDKAERDRVMTDFRKGTYRMMISSNLTARGIDVQQVGTVINFDIPSDVHSYLHRIGRSGRWGRKGKAINFMVRQDVRQMRRIEEHYGSTVEELPQDF
jgi:translation initiation factor 4A